MNIATAQKFVNKFSYKPGSKFSVYEDEFGLGLRFELKVVPTPETKGLALQAGDTLSILNKVAVPEHAWRNEDSFIQVVRQLVMETEMHEVDEWFKVDGVKTHDPHRK